MAALMGKLPFLFSNLSTLKKSPLFCANIDTTLTKF